MIYTHRRVSSVRSLKKWWKVARWNSWNMNTEIRGTSLVSISRWLLTCSLSSLSLSFSICKMEEHAALQVGKTTPRTVGRALHTMPGAEQNIQSLELLLLLLRFEIMLQQGKCIWNHGKQQQKKQDTTQNCYLYYHFTYTKKNKDTWGELFKCYF